MGGVGDGESSAVRGLRALRRLALPLGEKEELFPLSPCLPCPCP